MRAWCGSVALVALVACAASGNNDEATPSPEGGAPPNPASDGGEPEVDADDAAPTIEPRCSAAGWCVTTLPDTDLMLKDIWPFPNRAFAVAESPTLGVKVLEWIEADAAWKYIDDGAQNESGRGRYVGSIWAPSENEIYYGVSPGYACHGTRASSASPWSWTYSALGQRASARPDDGNPASRERAGITGRTPVAALGVWGTSSDDVYAWSENTIYHRRSSGGAPEWVAEYSATDVDTHIPGEQLLFFGAAGTGPDDVWFAGGRTMMFGRCALVVRKTSGTYQRIADGLLEDEFSMNCTPRAGSTTMMIGGAEGLISNVVALSPNRLLALKGRVDVVAISNDGDGYSAASVPMPSWVASAALNSISILGDEIWLSGKGLVVHGPSPGHDGEFELSTISLNGARLDRSLYQVRGTSNTNLWAIGDGYAFHKTTP